MKTIDCMNCKKPTPYRYGKKYCSDKCRHILKGSYRRKTKRQEADYPFWWIESCHEPAYLLNKRCGKIWDDYHKSCCN